MQQTLVAAEPERYFRPPYVGVRGWLGVYLDVPVDWGEVGAICRGRLPQRRAEQVGVTDAGEAV